jgi:hypothetical protein
VSGANRTLRAGHIKVIFQRRSKSSFMLPTFCVKVADATTVQDPGGKGTTWRIHYSLELSSLQCNEIMITGTEKGESFKNVTVQEGDLWIGDRIYAKAPGIDHVLSYRGDVLVRAGWNSLQLCDEQGRKFDLFGHLHNKNPESAKARLYGKLLAAFLIEALTVVSDRFFLWGYSLGKKTSLMEKRLGGDGSHVPFLPTSHTLREQSALTAQEVENSLQEARGETSKTPDENGRTAQ